MSFGADRNAEKVKASAAVASARLAAALPTAPFQLSADRARLIHENIEYDLYYIYYNRNQCFFMDLAILLHTLVFAAKGI